MLRRFSRNSEPPSQIVLRLTEEEQEIVFVKEAKPDLSTSSTYFIHWLEVSTSLAEITLPNGISRHNNQIRITAQDVTAEPVRIDLYI